MKVKGRKLISDGERPGIWTERSWADPVHPQRYVNVPPPDGLNYRPGPPATHSIGARVDLSWVNTSDTSFAFTDGTTQQPYGVLRRQPAPWMFAHLDENCLFIGPHPGYPQGELLWGGFELQWAFDQANIVWGGA